MKVHQSFQNRISELKKIKEENQKLKAENFRLLEQSKIDPLTGLFNQSHLKKVLGNILKESGEYCILFLDIDFFKSVNEQHGHVAASRLLKKVGKLLALHVREEDLAFRYGGDEFVIVLKGERSEALFLGERVRRLIETTLFKVHGFHGLTQVKLTVSVGVRVLDRTSDVDQILQEADKAMFEAKRRSRNCTVAA